MKIKKNERGNKSGCISVIESPIARQLFDWYVIT